jgi:hypothetical protein
VTESFVCVSLLNDACPTSYPTQTALNFAPDHRRTRSASNTRNQLPGDNTPGTKQRSPEDERDAPGLSQKSRCPVHRDRHEIRPPTTQTASPGDGYSPFRRRQLLRAHQDYVGPKRTHGHKGTRSSLDWKSHMCHSHLSNARYTGLLRRYVRSINPQIRNAERTAHGKMGGPLADS